MIGRNEVEGTLRNAAGHVQDAAVALTGDLENQVKGKGKQVAGHVQAEYGDVIDRIKVEAAVRPVRSLAIAGFIGFVLGAIWAKRD
jgi:uncharacterized protein YjbJ (UPF0337 family)